MRASGSKVSERFLMILFKFCGVIQTTISSNCFSFSFKTPFPSWSSPSRMVPRPDGSSSSTPRESTSASRDSSRRRSRTRGADDLPDDAGAADGYFLGAFTVPTNDAADPQQIQNIIQEQLQQLGGNAQVSTRTSPDGGQFCYPSLVFTELYNFTLIGRS